ncbi:MAG: hypothetical protein H6822_16885 [Planctomycetaceae bacterium]|nr:hypothetical protein [Planctomycetales bacterium]MCB9923860.1 hypothetical protein [Planctomycetaceae bacterium]
MNALDQLYLRLLQVGFLTIRYAQRRDELPWARVEVQFLHNIPTLIGEPNGLRHRCFWDIERANYLDQLLQLGRPEAVERMEKYYQPLFEEMQPLMCHLMEEADRKKRTGTDQFENPD